MNLSFDLILKLFFKTQKYILSIKDAGMLATEDLDTSCATELQRIHDHVAGGTVQNGRLLGSRGASVRATHALGFFQLRS